MQSEKPGVDLVSKAKVVSPWLAGYRTGFVVSSEVGPVQSMAEQACDGGALGQYAESAETEAAGDRHPQRGIGRTRSHELPGVGAGAGDGAGSHRFLNAVRTVQIMQRREKLAKMVSSRTINSVNSSDVGMMPLGERSRLLPAAGRGSDIDDDDHTFESKLSSPQRQSGNVPSVIIRKSNGVPEEDPTMAESLHPTPAQAVYGIFFKKGVLSWMLLASPLAVVAYYLRWSDTSVFCLTFVVLIPLASILSDFTEEAALHTNETIGGLLNASFGNAVEVVIMVQALLAHEIRVVQASLLGSILSNLLLVLGCCFFFGGLRYKEQTFNATSATANMGLLALSSIALILPTPYAEYYEIHDEHVLKVSRCAAVFLIFMYGQLLVFQLKTHAFLFDDSDSAASHNSGEEAALGLGASLAGLAFTTLLVAFFSEMLVDSIDGFVEASGISRTFVGLILLPIVGNVVEHVTAVTVAMKDKMDLAMGVAVGSCTQISLLVVPLSVLVGWATDRPMTLNFPHFEVMLYIMSVLTVAIVLSNPRCNWLEGSLLITTYLLIAVGFWFEEIQDF
jgi:Ca2+:H+ antiporter